MNADVTEMLLTLGQAAGYLGRDDLRRYLTEALAAGTLKREYMTGLRDRLHEVLGPVALPSAGAMAAAYEAMIELARSKGATQREIDHAQYVAVQAAGLGKAP